MINLDVSIFWQFANFFILMAVLNVLLYRPLRRNMAERNEAIAGDRKKAESLKDAVDAKMADYQNRLKEAKSKAGEERAALRAVAAKEENQILTAARKSAADEVQKVKTQVAADAKSVGETLRQESQTVAQLIASKVLGRNV